MTCDLVFMLTCFVSSLLLVVVPLLLNICFVVHFTLLVFNHLLKLSKFVMEDWKLDNARAVVKLYRKNTTAFVSLLVLTVNVIFRPYGLKSTVIIRCFPSLRTEIYKHVYAIFRPQGRKSTAKFRYFPSTLVLFYPPKHYASLLIILFIKFVLAGFC